jgi:hypothetical protein
MRARPAVDAIEQTVPATQSHLEYDPVAGQYNYIWKTTKGATRCWELVLQFNDGTTQHAVFRFK